jgi:hypothetical protein
MLDAPPPKQLRGSNIVLLGQACDDRIVKTLGLAKGSVRLKDNSFVFKELERFWSEAPG